jgi:hypothetical protein
MLALGRKLQLATNTIKPRSHTWLRRRRSPLA